jgi:alcohol dehydrogenase
LLMQLFLLLYTPIVLTPFYRENMMMASLMAGLAFSNASLGLLHSMAHSLGGALDLAHGECNAVLLEKVVGFNYDAAHEKYAELAKAMGVSENLISLKNSAPLVDCLASLRKELGITQRLSEMGVMVTDIPRLADYASKDLCLATNPRETTAEEIKKIYEESY